MPIRKFLILFDAIDSAMTYEAQILGRMTGMFASKSPIDHWVYKKEKGLYNDAQTVESYVGTINGANNN